MPLRRGAYLAFSSLLCACGSSGPETSASPADAGPGPAITNVRLDQIFSGATKDQFDSFAKGDGFFDLPFRDADGLGPLYVNVSCGECHNNGLRGPGFDQRMVMVEADGVTTAADQSPIQYGNEIRARMIAGATIPVTPPDLTSVKITIRTPPAIVGRGYIEAVLDSEIERVAAEQATRSDAIHGRVNYVSYGSQTTADPAFNAHAFGDTVIGRFGLKARVATLDDFAADAFQNDMGITSPLRPVELPNPNGLTDDDRPGVDIDGGRRRRRRAPLARADDRVHQPQADAREHVVPSGHDHRQRGERGLLHDARWKCAGATSTPKAP
jgi:CxxC motif-containing protein (DUF1111 family)